VRSALFAIAGPAPDSAQQPAGTGARLSGIWILDAEKTAAAGGAFTATPVFISGGRLRWGRRAWGTRRSGDGVDNKRIGALFRCADIASCFRGSRVARP